MASCIQKSDDLVVFDPTCGGGTFLVEASKRLKNHKTSLIANDIDRGLVALSELRITLSNVENHRLLSSNENIYRKIIFQS